MKQYKRMLISVVILTKNEEKNIEECLKTLKWVDEVIVVDDNSEDRTVKIARKMGARVFLRALEGGFSAQRNFGLEKAKGEWVLFVDADERVTPTLKKEILQLFKYLKWDGFYIKRQDFFGGRQLKYGETANVRLLRLARKGAGKWKRRVDEVWEIDGPTISLKNPLIHYPHQNLSEFLESINFFSALNAQVFYEEGKRTTFLDWFKPPAKFIQNYIFRLGFLDGMPGFLVALLMSFHSFLVRAKLYLIWKKGPEWR